MADEPHKDPLDYTKELLAAHYEEVSHRQPRNRLVAWLRRTFGNPCPDCDGKTARHGNYRICQDCGCERVIW